jgi:hypothetical protein
MHRFAIPVVFALLTVLPARAAEGFSFKDEAGQYLDVLQDGRIVGRYMYAYDKAKLNDTYKTYLHIFDAEGKAPITKGLGGEFPHHRGIFAGWNKITFNGKSYDRWHMKGGEQIHQKFTEQKADADGATFTSLIHWTDETGKAFIEEERTMAFRKPPQGAYVLVDFASKIKAVVGDVELNGDPEHAGVQYRPAAEVERPATVYTFPKEGAVPTKDLDYPWVGETYTLNGKQYSVVMMNYPENPKKTRWSAYRDYGRFGAFPVAPVKQGETLTLKYEFAICAGQMPSAETIQNWANAFAGTKDPAPKTTVIDSKPKGRK